jgi:hypothetical protein
VVLLFQKKEKMIPHFVYKNKIIKFRKFIIFTIYINVRKKF